jgi:hypothetical protein
MHLARASLCGATCPSFLSLLLVLETLVRPRGEYVGVTSVASAVCLLLQGLSGLSFCGRVETNFDAFVFHGGEEPVEAVGAAVGGLGVEKAGVDETLGDSPIVPLKRRT